ncbi:uncharacterized protein LOC131023490 [Salvia miltiorrhiza]|uniref:uncharacterized protein LOC131023490 n=1 Tax=Salvia miltiorrhiza TaxID=226208 RepID=UPI0025ACB697|nr:uncharacterized protein LOC131023490 [Salvia miltiorrhiza]
MGLSYWHCCQTIRKLDRNSPLCNAFLPRETGFGRRHERRFFSLDVDVAWRDKGNRVGIDFMVRNWLGSIVAVVSRLVGYTLLFLWATYVMMFGICFCLESDLEPIVVFSDSILVAHVLHDTYNGYESLSDKLWEEPPLSPPPSTIATTKELATKLRSIVLLKRQLDEVPAQAELIQYELRLSELNTQIQKKLRQTRKHYDTYNALLEIKDLMLKETSLLNSINVQFQNAITSVDGRVKLTNSLEGISNGTQQLLKMRCNLFEDGVFNKVLSIFITAAILKLGQAILDVILSWKARQSMSFHVKLRYILKVVSAAAWVVILPVTYAYTWKNAPGFAQTIKSWLGNSSRAPSLFILAVVIYLSPNFLAAFLFLFPFVRRFLERSNYKIVMLMMWWSQPRLYVGRGMHESTFSLFHITEYLTSGVYVCMLSRDVTF